MSAFGVTTTRAPGREDRIPYGPPPTSPEEPGTKRAPDGQDDVDEAADRSYRLIRIPRLHLPLRKMTAAAVFGVGLLVVLFVVYLFAFTPLSASRDQQRLAQTIEGQPLGVYKLVSGARPAEGQAVAVLTIPAIGLSQVVVQGTSAADLMNGPGLMPGTALPGAPGNAVVAARSTTFGGPFASIGTLKAGDRIKVVDGAGTFTYLVTTTRVVTAGEHDVVVQTPKNVLTLITSSGGVAPNGRLAVQAQLKGQPVAVQAGVVAVPHGELGLGGDGSAILPAVLWSLATILVLMGAALAVWLWRRAALVYLFAAPVVVACGLLACESVARTLPATF